MAFIQSSSRETLHRSTEISDRSSSSSTKFLAFRVNSKHSTWIHSSSYMKLNSINLSVLKISNYCKAMRNSGWHISKTRLSAYTSVHKNAIHLPLSPLFCTILFIQLLITRSCLNFLMNDILHANFCFALHNSRYFAKWLVHYSYMPTYPRRCQLTSKLTSIMIVNLKYIRNKAYNVYLTGHCFKWIICMPNLVSQIWGSTYSVSV